MACSKETAEPGPDVDPVIDLIANQGERLDGWPLHITQYLCKLLSETGVEVRTSKDQMLKEGPPQYVLDARKTRSRERCKVQGKACDNGRKS